jgi:low affinity Fe/Cu permease
MDHSIRAGRARAAPPLRRLFPPRRGGNPDDVEEERAQPSFARASRGFARRVPELVGSPFTFLGALAGVVVWLALGPVFDWSGGWVLWPATLTSVGALLLVILLQYSQNRDTRVLQLKLDELIRGVEQTRTRLVNLESLSDEEIARIEDEFRRLRDEARSSAKAPPARRP